MERLQSWFPFILVTTVRLQADPFFLNSIWHNYKFYKFFEALVFGSLLVSMK